jgi:hypothetical protein
MSAGSCSGVYARAKARSSSRVKSCFRTESNRRWTLGPRPFSAMRASDRSCEVYFAVFKKGLSTSRYVRKPTF